MTSRAKERRLKRREKAQAMSELRKFASAELNKGVAREGISTNGSQVAHSDEHLERQREAEKSGLNVNELSNLFQL